MHTLLTLVNSIAPFSRAYEHFEIWRFRRLPYRTAYAKLVEAAPLAPLALDAP